MGNVEIVAFFNLLIHWNYINGNLCSDGFAYRTTNAHSLDGVCA